MSPLYIPVATVHPKAPHLALELFERSGVRLVHSDGQPGNYVKIVEGFAHRPPVLRVPPVWTEPATVLVPRVNNPGLVPHWIAGLPTLPASRSSRRPADDPQMSHAMARLSHSAFCSSQCTSSSSSASSSKLRRQTGLPSACRA